MSEIILLVEGKTETAIKKHLKAFLDSRCEEAGGDRVRLTTRELDSRMLRKKVVRDLVANNLDKEGVIGVVSLIDVVCSGRPQQFKNAQEAIEFLESCHPERKRYKAHAAQHDFEAWLLPYWDFVVKQMKKKGHKPKGQPEFVNHTTPPSKHFKNLYTLNKRKYNKPLEAYKILKGKSLIESANVCPNFKSFLNSLLMFSGCALIP